MAEPEDKGVLAGKLEEDRKKMAVQAGELKDDYNPMHKVAVSIRKDPLAWIIATVLVGVLLARLLGRPKEILLSTESVDRRRAQELPRLPTDEDESSDHLGAPLQEEQTTVMDRPKPRLYDEDAVTPVAESSCRPLSQLLVTARRASTKLL